MYKMLFTKSRYGCFDISQSNVWIIYDTKHMILNTCSMQYTDWLLVTIILLSIITIYLEVSVHHIMAVHVLHS